MSRARPLEAFLAALATIFALAPLLQLVSPPAYVGPAVLVVLLVGVLGVVLRSRSERDWPLVLTQVLAALLATSWMFGHQWLWFGLPGPSMVLHWAALLGDAQQTVATSTVPAPATRGVVLGIVLIAGLLALVVDLLAVTRRAPAVAGMPLLAAYLVSAANVTEGLPLLSFVAASGTWLLLLGAQGTREVRRWGVVARLVTPESQGDVGADASRAAASGRRLGLAAIALALVLPLVLPHLPARYLTSGLGRSADGGGVGPGSGFTLNSTLDVGRDLRRRSNAEVLRYTTTAASPDPLRVAVTELYDATSGQWMPADDPGGLGLPDQGSLVADPSIRTTTYRVDVIDNRLRAPQLAAPAPVVQAALGQVPWSVTAGGDLRPNRDVGTYSVQYLRAMPTDRQLAALPNDLSADVGGTLPNADQVDLEAVLARVVPKDAGPVQTAWAIQEWLRGPDFVYSETLRPAPEDPATGRPMDPLRAFLTTRQGYCVQFATAMALLARVHGIPSRVALGYLPGALDSADGRYVVRSKDAHAWPELWFSGIGWLRFEPTPGTRSGNTVPAWSIAPAPTSTPNASASSGASAPTSSRRPTDPVTNPLTDPAATNPSLVGRVRDTVAGFGPLQWTLVIAVLGMLGALVGPLLAGIRRRHRYRRALDDAERVEASWQSLISRVGDVGITAPPGASPRATGQFIVSSARLSGPDAEAMRSVVATVERARYAEPGQVLLDVRPPAEAVWTAVARTRPARTRLRALVFPTDARPDGRWRREGRHR